MNEYICASIKTLETIKLDCDAKLIRDIWKAKSVDELVRVYPQADAIARTTRGGYCGSNLLWLKRECVNHAGGFHGVEFLGLHKRSGQDVDYCNAGDPYAGTIIFNGRRLSVGTWGDMVERGYIAELEY